MSSQKHERFIRYTLSILLLFVTANAFAGGYYGMTDAEGVPLAWLEGSPFHNYFIPGLFLFVCVGGSSLFAAIVVLRRHRIARKAAFSCGIIILLWLAVQMAIIGYVSWMQPATTATAIIILFLTGKLPKYGH